MKPPPPRAIAQATAALFVVLLMVLIDCEGEICAKTISKLVNTNSVFIGKDPTADLRWGEFHDWAKGG